MTYEHQDRYRRRNVFKARYFDQRNTERLAPHGWLRRSIQSQPCDIPEIGACVPYFLSHPRAAYLPHRIRFDLFHGFTCMLDRSEADAYFHAALLHTALSSVSSFPVDITVESDGVWTASDGQDIVQQVRKEIDELKALGMWVTE